MSDWDTGEYARAVMEHDQASCACKYCQALRDAGHCRCGKPMPAVPPDETPYEFCSEECKQDADNERSRS